MADLPFVPTGCDCDACDGDHSSRCAIYVQPAPVEGRTTSSTEEAAMSGDSHESPVDHDERCCMTVAGATEPHDICPGIPKSVAVSSCTCWRRSDDAHNHPPGWPCIDWCPEHPDHADSGVCGKVTHP